jgi:hypothetical protein
MNNKRKRKKKESDHEYYSKSFKQFDSINVDFVNTDFHFVLSPGDIHQKHVSKIITFKRN